jgi:hypothetical protein
MLSHGESEGAITRMVVVGMTFCALTAFLILLIAPVFAPSIREMLLRHYAMYPHPQQKVKEEMPTVYFLLWALCLFAWIVFVLLNINGYQR